MRRRNAHPPRALGPPVVSPEAPEDERSFKLPPERSGLKVLSVIVVLALIFLGLLWYETFLALQSRGPDLVVLEQESWDNGTIIVVVADVRPGGEVLLSSVNVTIRTAANFDLYDGPPGNVSRLEGFNLTVDYEDRDNSHTLTEGDRVVIRSDPPSKIENLILSTLYLTSADREWSRLSLPP